MVILATPTTNYIVYGANDVLLDLAGFSIAQIVYALADVLNMEPATVVAFVDGERVWNKISFVLRSGQTVILFKVRGRKGGDLGRKIDRLADCLDRLCDKLDHFGDDQPTTSNPTHQTLNGERLYSTGEVALILNRHIQTIRRLLNNKKIDGVKDESGYWWIRKVEIDNYLCARKMIHGE